MDESVNFVMEKKSVMDALKLINDSVSDFRGTRKNLVSALIALSMTDLDYDISKSISEALSFIDSVVASNNEASSKIRSAIGDQLPF